MYNLDVLWYDTVKQLMGLADTPSRIGPTKEIMGYQGKLTNTLWLNVVKNPVRKFSLAYACAEMLWYLSGTDNIDMIKAYAPSYENYAEDGIAWGAYGKRWATEPNQIETVYSILLQDPNSRQAIMTMYNVNDLMEVAGGTKHKDIPCTLSLQFLIRDRKLNLIANMRSNDVWLGYPYDIFCFTTLQMILAQMLELEYGFYVHQSGSEHIYEKHYAKAKELDPFHTSMCERPTQYPLKSLFHQVKKALKLEERGRAGFFNVEAVEQLHPLLADLVKGTWTQWEKSHKFSFHNRYYEDI